MKKPVEINRKHFLYDLVFMDEIKRICYNEPPTGSLALDFGVLEFPEYGTLSYPPEKEVQALEVLLTAVGSAWYRAKKKEIDKRG